MLIVVTILCILASIIACKASDKWFIGAEIVSIFGVIGLGIIDFILIICILVYGWNMFVIDDKIIMYEEENKIIETQITEIVNNYQGYEKEIISNIADMEVAIIKIPELKASELVKTQMQVYVENNDTIKELKEKKINIKVAKWLLYFGK